MDLLKTQRKYITPNGMELMVESEAHLKYITHMEGIHSTFHNNEYKLNMAGAVPSADKFMLYFV